MISANIQRVSSMDIKITIFEDELVLSRSNVDDIEAMSYIVGPAVCVWKVEQYFEPMSYNVDPTTLISIPEPVGSWVKEIISTSE